MTDGRFKASLPPLTRDQHKLVLDHAAFARNLTKRYARKYHGLMAEDDLAQLVQMGISESARGWKPDVGISFRYFAFKRIEGLVIDAARGEVKHRHLRRAAEACLDMHQTDTEIGEAQDVIMGRAQALSARVMTAVIFGLANEASVASASEGEEGIAERDMRRRVRAALSESLAQLSERRQRILTMYYLEAHELKDVASILTLGYSTIRREHNEALDELGSKLRALGLSVNE